MTDARLDIPWVGWSKGPGIAAAVEFSLTTSDKATRLSGLELRGKSFAIDGDIAFVGGGLSSARLKSVRLNRDDDASVTIDRKGKGFKIGVTGNSLDVRAIVKMLKADSDADDRQGRDTADLNRRQARQADRFPRRDAERCHIELRRQRLERQRVPLQCVDQVGGCRCLAG